MTAGFKTYLIEYTNKESLRLQREFGGRYGLSQHVAKALSHEDAKDSFEREYPDRVVVFTYEQREHDPR